eukprot:365042-Chlamydomonas_euryale.AAC.13
MRTCSLRLQHKNNESHNKLSEGIFQVPIKVVQTVASRSMLTAKLLLPVVSPVCKGHPHTCTKAKVIGLFFPLAAVMGAAVTTTVSTNQWPERGPEL